MKKLAYIDALRGIAILCVLMVHCSQYGINIYPNTVKSTFNSGAKGVQLFYIASAFTLFLSLSQRKEEKRLSFFIRRFFRIAPMYYIGVAYYLWQDGFGPRYWLGDAPGITLANIISNIFFIHGVNPYWITSVVPGGWSITVEMTFYCLVPFLFSKIKTLNSATVFFLISIIIKTALSRVLINRPLITDKPLWVDYLFLYFPSQLPVFACGIMLFFIVTKTKSELIIKPQVLILFFGMLLIQLITDTGIFFEPHIQFSFAFVVLAIGLSIRQFYLFVNPVTRYIGKISYSMYLTHFSVLYWLTHFGLIDPMPKNVKHFAFFNYSCRFVLLLIFTVIVSSVFYNLIETPLQRVGKRIIDRYIND